MEINKDYFIDLGEHKNEKTQIILLNTNAKLIDYLESIKLGINQKIPTFVIGKSGKIYQIFDPLKSSKLMDFESINHISISIALENHGPLLRFNDTGGFFNLRNQVLENINEQNVHEISWRDFRYWDKYTHKQKTQLIQLIDYLCNEYSINRKFVGHNNKIDLATNYSGIINRSNYSKIYYDLNPSMDFDWLRNEIEQYENE